MRELMMIAAFVATVLLVGRTEISFNPFYIRMDGWMNVVGYLLICVGLGFLTIDSYDRGRHKGFKEGVDHVVQYAEEKMKKDSINE